MGSKVGGVAGGDACYGVQVFKTLDFDGFPWYKPRRRYGMENHAEKCIRNRVLLVHIC